MVGILVMLAKYCVLSGLFAASLVLSGCVGVFKTTESFSPVAKNQRVACDGNSYKLPKGILSFNLTKIPLDPEKQSFRYELEVPDPTIVGDGLTYCIDIKDNIFASDATRVLVDQETRLLQKVYSNADDRADEAIQALVEGFAINSASERDAPTSRGAFGSDIGDKKGESNEEQILPIDPFNKASLTLTNRALRAKGYCIYIESKGDPLVPLWMNGQCPSHASTENLYSSLEEARPHNPPYKFRWKPKGYFGLLYKPMIPHTLVIVRRADPNSLRPWKVWKRKTISLPNVAPVFGLQIRRGLFTVRQTEVEFKNGSLISVKIDKKSEIEGAADLLLNIARVVVQIPSKALIISTSEADNKAKLIEANQSLIQLYEKLANDREKQLEKFDNLTEEQKAIVSALGATPTRSSDQQALNFEACVANALLLERDDAELLCKSALTQF